MVAVAVDEAPKERVSSIRAAILSRQPRKEVVEAFGQQIEIRQPSMRQILSIDDDGSQMAASRQLILCCFEPETGKKVFEEGDAEALADMPFDGDLQKLMVAIKDLMNINVEEAKTELKESPLSETPST